MIGQTISHYKVLERLGQGGMGVVYKAEDTRLHRTVALKFLPPELTRDTSAKARFIREAQAASALQHNNICTIHEIDETPDGHLFICMDYYAGETMGARVARGPLPLEEGVRLVEQAAQGLAKAHELGIVHRDVKPANIAVTADGVAKVLDFGLAKLVDRTRMTRLGTMMGTASYMSPEQAEGREVDRRADVWALGVTLYEVITGRLPFPADNVGALIHSIANEPHEPLTVHCPGAPVPLANVVDKALAKNPEDRYADAGEMLTDLKKVSDTLGPHRSASRPSQQRERAAGRKRLWQAAAALVLVAAAIMILKPVLFVNDVASAPRPVAVIGFENLTGNAQYDYLREVIPNLLITKLEQSEHLSVVSWERMRDLVVQSGREEQTLIDRELGFEVCRLEGIDAIVLGSYTRAGNVFVTDVKVLDVQTKELVKTASAKGEGVESILAKQVDELGHEISRGVGVSGRSIVADRPIAEVTTRSLDAYHYFLQGREEYHDYYPADARRSLEKALALDPDFAVAWLYLGRALRGLRDHISSDEAYAKAKVLAASAPEKDRLYIEAVYADAIENDGQKHHDLLRELIRKYPKEKIAHFQLGMHYSGEGEFEQAIASFSSALALDPNHGESLNGMAYAYAALGDYRAAIGYLERYADASPGDANAIDSMAEMYFRLGDLDEARNLYGKTLEMRPDFGSEARIAYIAALDGDYAGAIEWCERFIDSAPSIGLVGTGRLFQSFYSLLACREAQALRVAMTARDVFKQMGNTFALGGTWWMEGWTRCRLKQYAEAHECYEESKVLLEEANMVDGWMKVVFTYAIGVVDLKEDRIDAAKQRLAEMKALLSEVAGSDPLHHPMAEDYTVTLEAEILLAEGHADDAIEMCRKRPEVAIPSMSSSNFLFYNFPFEGDVLARAYVANGSYEDAIAEYEALVTFDPSSKDRRLVHPVFHYRLGLLYEDQGLVEKAASQYERYVEIVREADELSDAARDAQRRLEFLAPRRSRSEGE